MHSQQMSSLSVPEERRDEQGYGVTGHTGHEHQLTGMPVDEVPEHGHKKPVLDLVKDKVTDKVKKLKSKISKHRHGDHHDSYEYTSGTEEEEIGSPIQSPLQHRDQVGEQIVRGDGQGTSVIRRPLEGASLIPDPNAVSVGSGIGVHQAFGKPTLVGSEQLHEQVPSAAGQTSAGVTPYLAAHGFGGKSPEQEQHVSPQTGLEAVPGKFHGDKNRAEISKKIESSETSDIFAQDTGVTQKQESETQSADKPKETEKPAEIPQMTESLEAAHGTGGETLKEEDKTSKNDENVDTGVVGKERVSSKPIEQSNADKKPMTTRAVDTMISFKDALASKFGYGPKASPKGDEVSPMEIDVSEQNVNVSPSHEKSYTEKLQETAGEAKDTVVTGMHIVQETFVEAKDVLASKVGSHGSKEEGDAGKSSIVSGQEEHTATAATPRFHPGDEDRALSQLITEKLTLGATTLKDKLMRPFGIKSKPTTPTSTAQQPPPALSHALSEEKPVTASEGEKEQQGQQGLVGKAREAVGSMVAPVTSPSTPSASEQPPPALSHALGEEKPVAESEGEKEQHQGLVGKAREAVGSMLAPVTSHLSASSNEDKQVTEEEGGDKGQQGMIGKVSETISSMLTPHGKLEESHSSTSSHEEKQVMEEEGGDRGQQGVIGKVSETISSMLTPHGKGEESHSSTSSLEEKQVTEEGGDEGKQGVIGKVSESISYMLTPHGKGEESHTMEPSGEKEQQGLVGRASEIIHSMLGETPHTASEEMQEVKSGGDKRETAHVVPSQTPSEEKQVNSGGEMLGKASEMIHSTPKTEKPDESGVCSVEMH